MLGQVAFGLIYCSLCGRSQTSRNVVLLFVGAMPGLSPTSRGTSPDKKKLHPERPEAFRTASGRTANAV
jgi:hypothetical protein